MKCGLYFVLHNEKDLYSALSFTHIFWYWMPKWNHWIVHWL